MLFNIEWYDVFVFFAKSINEESTPDGMRNILQNLDGKARLVDIADRVWFISIGSAGIFLSDDIQDDSEAVTFDECFDDFSARYGDIYATAIDGYYYIYASDTKKHIANDILQHNLGIIPIAVY